MEGQASDLSAVKYMCERQAWLVSLLLDIHSPFVMCDRKLGEA